jgi:hypothetical protein
MRKTRRKLYGKSRRRRQRGGVNLLKALLVVVAAATVAANGATPNPESVKQEAIDLAKDPDVVSDIKVKHPIAALDDATAAAPMKSVQERVIAWANTVDEVDKAVYGGLSAWFLRKAKEVEDADSLAPLGLSMDSFSAYIPSGWMDATPTPTAPPPTEVGLYGLDDKTDTEYEYDGKRFTVYTWSLQGDKASLDTSVGRIIVPLDAVFTVIPPPPASAEEEYIEGGRRRRKSRRKTLRRKK